MNLSLCFILMLCSHLLYGNEPLARPEINEEQSCSLSFLLKPFATTIDWSTARYTSRHTRKAIIVAARWNSFPIVVKFTRYSQTPPTGFLSIREEASIEKKFLEAVGHIKLGRQIKYRNFIEESVSVYFRPLFTGNLLSLALRKREILNPKTLEKITHDLLRQLVTLHEHLNMTHNDLKPENILVQYPDGDYKYLVITDFETSEVIGAPSTSRLRTKYFYNSLPRDKPMSDSQLDLFATRVTLTILYSGLTPRELEKMGVIKEDGKGSFRFDDSHLAKLAISQPFLSLIDRPFESAQAWLNFLEDTKEARTK